MGVLTAWMVMAAAGLPASGVDFEGPRIEVRLQSPGGMLLRGETPQLAWGELTLEAQDRVQAPQLTYGDRGTMQARIRSGEDTYELKLSEAGFPPHEGKKPAVKTPVRTEGGVALKDAEELDTVTVRGLAELKHNGKVVTPNARVWVTADRGRGPALRVVVDGLPKKQFPGGKLEARFDDVLIARAGQGGQEQQQAQAPARSGTGGSGDSAGSGGEDGAKSGQARRDTKADARDDDGEGEGWIREARPGEPGVLSVMEFEAIEEDRKQVRRYGDREEPAANREDEGRTGTGGAGEGDGESQERSGTGGGGAQGTAGGQGTAGAQNAASGQNAAGGQNTAGAQSGEGSQNTAGTQNTADEQNTAGAGGSASAGTGGAGAQNAAAQNTDRGQATTGAAGSASTGTGGAGAVADTWVDPYGPAPQAAPRDAEDGATAGASPLIDSSDLTPVAAGRTVAIPPSSGGFGGGGLAQGSGNVLGRDAARSGAYPGMQRGPQGVAPGFDNGLREATPQAGFDAADGVGSNLSAVPLGSAQARALNSTTRPLDPRLAPIDYSSTPSPFGSTTTGGATVDLDRPVGSTGVPGAAAMAPGSRSDLGVANGAQVAPGIPGSSAPLNNGRFPEAMLNMSGIGAGLPGTPAPLNDGRFPLGPQGIAPSPSGVDAQSQQGGTAQTGGLAPGTTLNGGGTGNANTVGTAR